MSKGLFDPNGAGAYWEEHTYYETTFGQHWTHSLDEEFERSVFFPVGSVFVVELLEWRPVYVGGDDDEEHHAYVILKALDPRVVDGSTLRFGFWADVDAGREAPAYIQIDEPLVILALAGKGLAP